MSIDFDIVPISDSHNQRPKLPAGDLLIHAGDISGRGEWGELERNAKWLQAVKPQYPLGVIFVPGNHDLNFDPKELADARKKELEVYGHIQDENSFRLDRAREIFESRGIKVLVHEEVVIEGIKIFGSPYTPWFHDWAFNRGRTLNEAQFRSIPFIGDDWKKIPDDVNVLVTHGPPIGIGDLCRNGHVGCKELLERIAQLKDLKMHIFGHIHEGAGYYWNNNRLFVNASVLDGHYCGFNDIHIVRYPELKINKFPDGEI